MIECGSVFWGVDVIVSVGTKDANIPVKTSLSSIARLLRTKGRGRQQHHSHVLDKMSITQSGNISSIDTPIGNSPFHVWDPRLVVTNLTVDAHMLLLEHNNINRSCHSTP